LSCCKTTSTVSSSEETTNTTSGTDSTPVSVPAVAVDVAVGARLVNGYQAFYGELQTWNLEHLLSRYVLDVDLHTFVRDIFEGLVTSDKALSSGGALENVLLQWYHKDMASTIPLQIVQFGCTFLFEVVLKCRERSATRNWVTALKSYSINSNILLFGLYNST